MLRGERGFFWFVVICLVFAMVAWTALRPAYPSLPTNEYLKAEETGYSPSSPRCLPSRLKNLSDTEAADERYRCEVQSQTQSIESADLVQQARSADAANASVQLTYRQLLVEIAAGICGLLTLLAAAYAAWYARRAAEANHVANNIARDGNRAWLSLEAGESGVLWIRPNELEFTTPIELTNFGNSPALDVWGGGFIGFARPTDEEILRRIAESESGDDVGRTIIFPSKAEGTQLAVIFNQTRPESAEVYVTVFCRYRVIGDATWHSTAFTYTTIADDAATRLYGVENGKLKLVIGADQHHRVALRLSRGQGGLPIAT